MIVGHSTGIRIEKTAQAYCRKTDCDWVGPERNNVNEARADAREHVNPSKPVFVATAGRT